MTRAGLGKDAETCKVVAQPKQRRLEREDSPERCEQWSETRVYV